MIAEVPKFGNDLPEVDYFARDVAYTYTRPLQNFKNPRGGQYQAGLYPVSANVPLGGQTGATPDGRYAHTPVADGVSPSAGKDVNGADRSSKLCCQTGSLHCIQWYSVQSEVPSVSTVRT